MNRGVRAGLTLLGLMMLGVAAAGLPPDRLDIPWEALDLASQRRLREVTDHAILSRDTVGVTVNSRQPIFDYLIDHPDVVADAGRVLKIVSYRVVKQREGLYWGDDGRGATGTFELIHVERGKRIYLSKGTFVKRLLPTIHGRMILIVAYDHRDGRHRHGQVITDVRGHVKIDNPILGVLARIATPVLGPLVDKQVHRTFAAVGKLIEQASNDPGAVYKTLAASPEMDPHDLQEFGKVFGCCPNGRAEWSSSGWSLLFRPVRDRMWDLDIRNVGSPWRMRSVQ